MTAPTSERESGRRSSRPNFIYFVTNGDRVKIGISENPARRAYDLSLRPESIQLMLYGSAAEEAELHARFAADRVDNTEWFHFSPAIRAFIAERKERMPTGAVSGSPTTVGSRLKSALIKLWVLCTAYLVAGTWLVPFEYAAFVDKVTLLGDRFVSLAWDAVFEKPVFGVFFTVVPVVVFVVPFLAWLLGFWSLRRVVFAFADRVNDAFDSLVGAVKRVPVRGRTEGGAQ